MSNVYPLSPQNYRLSDEDPKKSKGQDITVVPEGANSGVAYDEASGTSQLAVGDDVIISFGPPQAERKESEGFDENLAEQLSEGELSTISERLLMGIEQDSQSRDAWLQNMSDGISLLGLEVKQARGAAVAGSTPAEGISVIDHPLLLEAVLRFQANAYGELLPSDGPVKIRNDGEGNALATSLADALEKDLNHYLIKVAKEYYPDTDRMLLQLGFCGISFKKGYHDPIKRRPVIASIDAKDLIVSNAATDLDGAGRVTHRIMMRPSTMKRMQLVGAYRQVELGAPPMGIIKNAVDAKIDLIQGIAPPTYVDAVLDQDRELYECYCEIEVPGFEHELEGEPTGLPLPYKVVLDKESRKILEIRRNWHEEDLFCLPRNRIIAYTFVPGLGFYGIGLLNILGNSTKAVTAAWRLMIDAGMFANFPGFLYVKSLAKQLTNQFRVPPGGGQPIDTVGQDIRAAVMPLPYKDPSAVFIQLVENIAVAAQRVGGTAELQIGEGKQDAPVGTTLAMIEQATKLMSAVHKRLHQAQGQEFDMLRSLLMEDPEALWRHNKKSKVLEALAGQAGQGPLLEAEEQAESRHRERFLAALADLQLVPAADPNTSSQTERYLKVVAMRQMAQTNQSIDLNKVDERAMRTMGIDDPESYFIPPPPGPPEPPPEKIMAQATMMAAQARLQDAQTKQQEVGVKQQDIELKQKLGILNAGMKAQELVSREKIAHMGVVKDFTLKDIDHKGKHHDRQHAVGLADMGHRREMGLAHLKQGFEMQRGSADRQHAAGLAQAERHHGGVVEAHKMAHEAFQKHSDRQHEAGLAHADRQQSMITRGVELQHEHVQGEAQRGHEATSAEAQRKHDAAEAVKDRAHQKAIKPKDKPKPKKKD